MPKIVVEQLLTEETLDGIVRQELTGLTAPLVIEIKIPSTLRDILTKHKNIVELTEQDVAQSVTRVLRNIHELGIFPKVVNCQFVLKPLGNPYAISIELGVRIVPSLTDPIDIPGPDNLIDPDPDDRRVMPPRQSG